MRGLRILHVIGGGDSGGAMTHLLPLLSALQALGCDVHLLCLGEGALPQRAAERGLPVRVIPMRNPWDGSALPSIRRALGAGPWTADAAGHWDVVHTHGMRANLPVRLLMTRSRRRPCLFTTVHSDLLLDYSSRVMGRVYQALDLSTVRLNDTVVCVSDSLRRLLAERGYPGDRLVRIWSGIEWPAGERTGGDLSVAAPGRTSGRPRIGTVARLVPVKDLQLLLEVTAYLRRTYPEVECVIVGDGPEARRLEASAHELGLAEGVEFTGRIDGIQGVLAGLDVFMVTSVFEGGVSMSVLEAMAAGLPVVTTAAGGVAEAVNDGQTGFVVRPQGSRSALVAALARRTADLLSDETLRRRMGSAGRERVRSEFMVQRTAVRTRTVYERCLVGRDALL